jgi:hypothetical protein
MHEKSSRRRRWLYPFSFLPIAIFGETSEQKRAELLRTVRNRK